MNYGPAYNLTPVQLKTSQFRRALDALFKSQQSSLPAEAQQTDQEKQKEIQMDNAAKKDAADTEKRKRGESEAETSRLKKKGRGRC